MMKVSNDATVNIHLDPQVLLKKYEREIKELRQELAMHDTLANRGRISYEPYSPEQQYQQQVLAKKFLDQEIEDIEFESLRQVKELFLQFRNIYKALLNDVKNNNYIDKDKNIYLDKVTYLLKTVFNLFRLPKERLINLLAS